MAKLEEEKKSEEPVMVENEDPLPPGNVPPPVTESPKPVKPEPPLSSSGGGKSFLIGGARFCFLDLPIFLLLTAFGTVMLIDYAKEEFFATQYEGLMWDGDRRAEEITYYTRVCTADDVSTENPLDLFLPTNGTAEEGTDIMMKHGFTVIPGVIKPENAARLRDYVDLKSQTLSPEEDIWVVSKKNRYSFNLGTEEPGVNEVLEDLGNHKLLTETVEAILGPDPAMIELTVITAKFGAGDQHYHDDAVPDGSPSRFAHAFAPALSVFITLQNLTESMGITSACPGTHYCSESSLKDVCNKKGFQIADENGELHVGDTFLFNMNVWHRGAAHTEPEGIDRVMLIVSFTPRPKDAAESRQMVYGITYAMRWDMWGFTWRDLHKASENMVRPFTYLRALGLWKPRGAVWGLDYFTSSTMRAAGNNNGFSIGEVDDAEITWLPKFLRMRRDEIETGVSNAWFWFMSDQIEKVLKILKKGASISILFYMAVFGVAGVISTKSVNSFGPSFFVSIRRVAIICAIVVGILYTVRSTVNSTQWAKDLKARRRFSNTMANQVFFDEIKEGPTSFPNTNDVLIENRYGYKDLYAYNHMVDYHPGNQKFRAHVDAVAISYASYPDNFKEASAKYIAETVIVSDGRFMEQGQEARWHWAGLETAVYLTKKALASRSMRVVGAVLEEARHLTSEMRYGVYRKADLAFLSATFLKELTQKMLTACIGKAPAPASTAKMARPPKTKPEYADDGVTVLSWKVPVAADPKPLIQSPRLISAAPESPAKHVPRSPRSKFVPKEPKRGAWIKAGDEVEVKESKNWYQGKVETISAHGNFKVALKDWHTAYFEQYDIRSFFPYKAGEKVGIFVRETEDKRIYEDGLIIGTEKNGNYSVKATASGLIRLLAPNLLRRKAYGGAKKADSTRLY